MFCDLCGGAGQWFHTDPPRSWISTPKICEEPYFLFTKSSDWKTEEEFRYIAYCKNDEEILVSINECLVGVVFGHKFPIILKEKVIEHFNCDKTYIELQWWNGIPNDKNYGGYRNYKEYLYYKCCSYFQSDLSAVYDKALNLHFSTSHPKNRIETLSSENLITNSQKQKLLEYYTILTETSDKSNEFLIELYHELKNIFEKI